MTATYVAWNGKSYPSPPPEGWYEASDGRWWAPGTGPNPPGQAATAIPQPAARQAALAQRPNSVVADISSATTKASATVSNTGAATTSPADEAADTSSRGSRPRVDLKAVAATAAAQRAQVLNTSPADTKPVESKAADQDHTSEFRVASAVEQRTVSRSVSTGHRTSAEVSAEDSGSAGDASTTSSTAQPGTEMPSMVEDPKQTDGIKPPVIAKKVPTEEHDGRSRKELALIAVVAVAVLAAVGFTFAALTGNGGDSTTAASTNTTAADPADTSATTTIEAPSTEAQTTEAVDITTTSSPAQTTTTLSDPERVAQFRAGLEDNLLSTESLSDQDIIDFGQSFCLFAIVSTDSGDFETYRLRAIAESTTDLTPEELTLAIDQALASFCPEHAQRLGLL